MSLSLPDLFEQKPREMGAVEAEIVKAVAKVEKENPDKPGGEKEALALQIAYDALDMLMGFPGPVDHLMKSFVIPHIPQLIKWAVDEFNKIGWPDGK